MRLFSLNVASFTTAIWTKPATLGVGVQADTSKVEPLDLAVWIVAADHLTIRHLLTETVGGLVRVYLVAVHRGG